ncbi:putative tubulin polyglutamylase TTLL1 [Monoraphidium neglectum]|uniref:Putative tubulin polyglutamylase TTLL1 n=1 Tax=Monoraphidium neglectum TaxID=145388 RepID=A0A0D2N6W4_9CHLO|nr:putative tubulin polyglutamylase TTLL1 [Monoraphidium neglectum]KIZ01611.1 putative tubulin polyglutamylase TTLL1 [Monoraphidium neglectum]|eukprot:XP_013900630.1 putative tubulin polyglutamylase TTLL1 [Monoraphidium neglectum]
MSKLGFARFCSAKYTDQVSELDNALVHLTNVAVQKGAPGHDPDGPGGKWALENLRLHLEAIRGHAATEALFADIEALVVHTLRAVQPVMVNDKHCFELYGFDVILDDALKPWLIEVNASPSLSTTTKADRLLKSRVISDVLDAVTPQEWSSGPLAPQKVAVDRGAGELAQAAPGLLSNAASACGGRQIIGSFEVVCDEAQDSQLLQRLRKEAAAAAAAATHAPVPPPASPARQRALLQGGVRPKAVEPDKKLLLR